MFESLQSTMLGASALACGMAAGSAWIAVILVPNESFDHMDHSRADRHVREVLRTSSTFIAILSIAAACFALLGGAIGATAFSALAAFGFLTNRWTLAPRKKEATPPGARKRRKSQRVVAVSLSLMFGLVAFIAGVMAVLGF